RLQAENPKLVVRDPPFHIPEFELKMAWSPLLHHNPAHRWMRQLILFTARKIIEDEERSAGLPRPAVPNLPPLDRD
ncbi:MAG: hypothetical protein WBJ03_01835, partial [Moraxellaceae bacterium]